MDIKKALIVGAIAASVLASAIPAFAEPPSYGEQPGYSHASACGAGHGSFGYFGNFGYAHDANGYDEERDGEDENVGNGAEGGVDDGTGDRNSGLCGNPQNTNF